MRHRRSKKHRDPEALEARRLQAAALFAEGLSRAAVARQLGVTRASAGRWYQQWKERGEAGLRSQGRPGPDPRLSEATRQELEEALLAGPEAAGYATELWTLPRVRRLIEERFGVRYHLSHVWLLLRQLGFTWQKPTPRAKERDEAAIAHWLKQEWPRLKRGRAGEAPRSSSGTKRASRSALR